MATNYFIEYKYNAIDNFLNINLIFLDTFLFKRDSYKFFFIFLIIKKKLRYQINYIFYYLSMKEYEGN